MLFICYPKCSTCRRAQQWLDGQGVKYTLRDIRLDRPTEAELRDWHEKSGLQYKALGLKDRLPSMSEDEQFALLASDGMLVKRPILATDSAVLVGFREAEWAAALEK